jgi:hypothetical protein
MALVVTNCNEQDTVTPQEEAKEYGYLSLQLALQIEELPAGRTAGVNTDNFIVTIHRASDGIEVLRFDPFSSAPGEIELETGEYFVRATNLEPPENAEFEQPWYFGESEVFNIDKEELKTIDVVCTLANFKVSFVYSQNVLDNFTDWHATATLINEGNSLLWPKGDDREGYFIASPLNIDVHLEYTKVFTGEVITRNFGTTIDDPQPATHYRINIDASLEDGKIVINLSVDDSFEVIDIDLGDGLGGLLPGSQIIIDPADEQMILGWLDPSFYFEAGLLFSKQSGEVKSASDFHNASDNIPNTLVVVKTTDGYVFGAYNQGVWDAPINGYTGNLLNNFLFSINNNQRWLHRSGVPNANFENYSIYNSSSYGPTFGGGFDMTILSDLATGYTYQFSYYMEGTDPNDLSGLGYHSGFTGTNGQIGSWTVETIEVWELNTSGNPL